MIHDSDVFLGQSGSTFFCFRIVDFDDRLKEPEEER
jgi:hypothetical protein